MAYWLGIALGLSFALAVVPVGSIEVFLVGLVLHRPDIPWLLLGAVVAVGQVFGKLVHYYAARGVLRLPAFVRPSADGEPETKGWRGRMARTMAKAADRADERPGWLLSVFGVSALVGLPPFGATSVLAGVVGMRVSVFLGVALPARWIRYCGLAAAPSVVQGILF
jgi:membrane protein YqaA with SNARE-associated domain